MIALRHRRLDLELRHTFRLARGASDVRSNLLVELDEDGRIGLGEAAPLAHYGQDCRAAAIAVDAMAGWLEDPAARESAAAVIAAQPAAEAAVDMALWDLAGKRVDAPLGAVMGIDSRPTPPTSFTIGLDTPEAVARKVREAGDFEVLKVKLGSDEDRAVLEAVRDETDRPVRVDANEGWTLEEAVGHLEWLAHMGVELVEQPLPADQIAESRELRRLSPLPIVADESVHRAADIKRLAGAFDGINIKLMKCGGLERGEAHDRARAGARHEGDVGLHDRVVAGGDRGGPPVAAGRLGRPRRQPADHQRPVRRGDRRGRSVWCCPTGPVWESCRLASSSVRRPPVGRRTAGVVGPGGVA